MVRRTRTRSSRSHSLPALATTLGLAAMLTATTANAAVPKQVSGARGKRFRLHADTDLFGWTHANPEGDGSNINVVGFGFGRPTVVDNVITAWGLGLGFVVLESRALLGFRTSFVVDGTGSDINDEPWSSTVRGQFVPYFRYLFLRGRRFRPFVEARLGLGGTASFAEDPDGSRVRGSTIFPVAGAGAGVHLFIIDAFSFDAGVTFDYLAPHSRSRRIEPDGTSIEDDYDKASDVFNLALRLGFSVWFG